MRLTVRCSAVCAIKLRPRLSAPDCCTVTCFAQQMADLSHHVCFHVRRTRLSPGHVRGESANRGSCCGLKNTLFGYFFSPDSELGSVQSWPAGPAPLLPDSFASTQRAQVGPNTFRRQLRSAFNRATAQGHLAI